MIIRESCGDKPDSAPRRESQYTYNAAVSLLPGSISVQTLRERVSECMLRDRPMLRQRLQRAERLLKQGRPASQLMADVSAAIAESSARRQRRVHERPRPQFPLDLPVVQKRTEIARAISENQVIVLCGETGSGKTTQLPKICLELGRGVDGMIGHTQPRRIAARSVASRIAQELGTSLGN